MTSPLPQRRWAIALMAGLAPLLAWSADPVAGASKFSQNCAACHSVASTSSVDRGRNDPTKISGAIASVGQMGGLSSLSSSDLADIAAYLGNAPSSLSFSQTTVGQRSASQVVTVRASTRAALTGLSASVDGDYALQGGTCGSSLAAGSSCTLGVVFAPTAAGSRSGTLHIQHSGISTPVNIALRGTASAATQASVSLSASSLNFGSQTVGASSSRSLTVSNTGNAALALSSLTLSGTAAADFSTSGSCSAGASVAAGASCSLTVSFSPSAAGSRSASLALASNASNGTATVTLSGTGQTAAAPVLSLGVSRLSFGNVAVGASSAAQAVTLSNSGTATLNLQSIQTSAPFTVSSDCGSTLAAGASCSASVRFSPTGTGAASGSLQISSDAAGSPQSVSLSGTGINAGAGTLQWSSSSALDFGSVQVGSEASLQTVTLSNTGSVAATLGALSLGGAQAADFRIDTGSSCAAGQALAVGASCTVRLGFAPQGAGSRAATLNVSSSDAGVPAALALSGQGVAVATGVLEVSSDQTTLEAPVGGSATPAIVTLRNSGSADLSVQSIALDNSRFVLSTPSSGGCAGTPFTLAAGQSCAVQVGWLGSASDGREQAVLTVSADHASATLSLQAQGADSAQAQNNGGGGCTLAAGTRWADPTLWLLAVVAGLLIWRRRQAR